MSDGIENEDRIFSTRSSEWHGKAQVRPDGIGDAEIQECDFIIREGAIVCNIDGASVPLGAHKAIIADFTTTRPESIGTDSQFLPLHIPKNSYKPITNRQLWDAMLVGISGTDATISSLGTLEGCKKFFISVDLGEDSRMKICGEKYEMSLNFLQSHDGTLAAQAFDSSVRIVCMNTLRASLGAKGELGFKVYHTEKASLEIQNMGKLINDTLTGRALFKLQMETANSIGFTAQDTENFGAGYFREVTQATEKLSTNSRNQLDEIVSLFSRGKGNNGRTVYDAINGATEFWTSGNGTGKNSKASERAYKANFGKAADHKTAFASAIIDDKRRVSLIESGKEILAGN